MSRIKEYLEIHADGVKSVFINENGEIGEGGLNIIEDNCPFCDEPCEEPHCPYTEEK